MADPVGSNPGFVRRPQETAAAETGQGRFAEPVFRQTTPDPEPAKRIFDIPIRPIGKASLVERDNGNELLEFHWNPSSYKIGKKAAWTDKAVPGGHPTLEYKGVSLTKISFELLLNNVGNHHTIDRSVEDSLQWLFDRLRPRTKEDVDRKPGLAPRNLPWLGIRNLSAKAIPPILVLFGVSKPFVCVLESVDVVTIFQGQPAARTRGNTGLLVGAAGDAAIERLVRDQEANLINENDIISRATVSIGLKEYANDPATEGTSKG
jgi:hypothetical protein